MAFGHGGFYYLAEFITETDFLTLTDFITVAQTMSHFPLSQLLDVIDRLRIRYLRESRTQALATGIVVAQHFPGTNIPAVIDTSGVDPAYIGKCIYKEQWQCCGEYGCTGAGGTKAKTRSHRCKAQMTVCVYMTGRREQDQCEACVLEDEPALHGSHFAAPEAVERNDWRSKVIIAIAAAAGVRTIGELLSERYWDAERVPLPQTKAERTSLRVRLAQLNKKLAKEAKKKELEEEEEEVGEEEEEEEEEEAPEPLDDPVAESVLDEKLDASGKRMCLVKWRHWPASSATWEAANSPSLAGVERKTKNAYRM